LLGRALLHAKLVAERNHALREDLVLDAQDGGHVADAIDGARRRKLDVVFRGLRGGGSGTNERDTLVRELLPLLDAR
jgi:hypothetical protein